VLTVVLLMGPGNFLPPAAEWVWKALWMIPRIRKILKVLAMAPWSALVMVPWSGLPGAWSLR
jgi:hypothetical protein